MSLTAQISAYEDCEVLYHKAAADPLGVRARFDTYNEAFHFQNRMHRYRDLQRRESKRIYKSVDQQYGKSMYDTLVVYIRMDDEDKWWVYVTRRPEPQVIESLSITDGDEKVDNKPIDMLPITEDRIDE